jgi:ABC-type amino acid transport substrate-binding protein
MSNSRFAFILIAAFLAGLLGAYAAGSGQNAGKPIEVAFDRVMRTQTLRCGYGVWPPLLMKDTNTGKMSGIFYDYMEALGQALHIKIDWTGEVGLGDFPTALMSGRIDGMCYSIWPSASRARQIDFTSPIFYIALYAYVRADDHRFDNNLAAINSPNVTIVAMDGEMGSLIAAADFPKAKTLQLPQLSNAAELFTNVASGKADVSFADAVTAMNYQAANPGKIRQVQTPRPVRVFGNTIALAQGENRLRRMLDTATNELLSSGQIEKILVKYEPHPGSYLRVAPPYEEKSNSPRQ